jgi:hypothetical protein
VGDAGFRVLGGGEGLLAAVESEVDEAGGAAAVFGDGGADDDAGVGGVGASGDMEDDGICSSIA